MSGVATIAGSNGDLAHGILPIRISDQTWPAGTPPLVSICCWTYNDVAYIRDCIEGILTQETTFPVEIILHDDASTDGTAEIARKYEDRYPHLFNNILNPQNVYSRGGDIEGPLLRRAKGAFIAFCHGDDYWSDPRKLQTQVLFLNEHDICSMCFHPALVLFGTETQPAAVRNRRKSQTAFLTDEEVIVGMGGYFPTSAVMLRRKEVLTELALIGPVDIPGDHVLSIASYAAGKIGYIDRAMSVYRRHPKSLTQAYRNRDPATLSLELQKQYQKTLNAISYFDKFLELRASDLFAKCRASYTYWWAATNIALLDVSSAHRLNMRVMRYLGFRDICALYLRYLLRALRLKW